MKLKKSKEEMDDIVGEFITSLLQIDTTRQKDQHGRRRYEYNYKQLRTNRYL